MTAPEEPVQVRQRKTGQSNAPKPTEEVHGSSASGEETVVPGGYEFGGPLGVSAIMLGFPLLMYYMYLGAYFYDGRLPLPAEGQTYAEFAQHLGSLVYEHAYPNRRAWITYWTFAIFEAICYVALPGITATGKRLSSLNGQKLEYYCSGMWSFYTTIVVTFLLNYTGLFRLASLIEDFGPLMSVSILSGILVSLVEYFSALARGVQIRMSGNHIYDFFMGAELNPRIFGIDLKMFYEVRIPWYMLFLISGAAAAKQWEDYGYITPEVGFLLMAHYLYANACAKGEDLIVTSWDMFYEKLGFMLTFWNLSGVPLSYCHAALYLALHHPSEYQIRSWFPNSTLISGVYVTVIYAAYLFAYFLWDTANSQKNRFRAREAGRTNMERTTFPQLPWRDIENPHTLENKEKGHVLLVDGIYAYARKIHYACDTYFAINWGLVTGFASPFPWFYTAFFIPMIIHRAARDISRCREKYGYLWKEYEEAVPALFVPLSWPQIIALCTTVGSVVYTVRVLEL